MALFNKPVKNDEQEEVVPIGVIDPFLERFYSWVDKTPVSKIKTLTFSVVAAVVVVSVLFAFLPLNTLFRYISAIIGLPFGIIVAFTIVGLLHVRNKAKAKEDANYVPSRLRHSPTQRRRSAMIWGVVVLIASIAGNQFVPYITGGVIVTALLLVGYNFIRRTPEEIARDNEGLPDPRDIVENDEDDELVSDDVADATEKETQDYIELVNSLPEAQRKILLNPKLNGALAVVDEDDIKKKKKRKLFGK